MLKELTRLTNFGMRGIAVASPLVGSNSVAARARSMPHQRAANNRDALPPPLLDSTKSPPPVCVECAALSMSASGVLGTLLAQCISSARLGNCAAKSNARAKH